VTDILLKNFDFLPVSDELRDDLKAYKVPIEVHVLHVTMWRDTDYRDRAPDRERVQRFDWNIDNSEIVDLLFRALDEVSKPESTWAEPFRYLYKSAKLLLESETVDWPADLNGEPGVTAYLKKLGLS
jgi:hypothetical protein